MDRNSKKFKTCFIVMPIRTPEHLLTEYEDDVNHFTHILEHLFIPVIEDMGLEAISPVTKGSEVIHGEIITKLVKSDIILCDMSTMNPNVFFELGIRTALDKPVCLVMDDKTTNIPFDTSIINRSTYPSQLRPWNIESAQSQLKKHLEESLLNSSDRNSLWKYFGILESGEFKAAETTEEQKLDFIIKKVESIFYLMQHHTLCDSLNKDNIIGHALLRDKLYDKGRPYPWGSNNPVRINFETASDFDKCMQHLDALEKMGEAKAILFENERAIELTKDGCDSEIYKFFNSLGIKARINSRP